MKVYSNNGEKYGYYGYDASGERTYKIELHTMTSNTNVYPNIKNLEVDKLTMYPNGYINIDQFGNYTKHYYAEDQRIASKIGGGYSGNICGSLIAPDPIEVMKEELGKVVAPNDTIDNISYVSNSLGSLQGDDPTAYERGLYFYHGNHLSSTQIITDITGSVVQQVLYAPFGEVISEYNAYWHNGLVPDYMFNGKELDEESGMYYYSARYYAPPTFISRDPHFEKYPTLSPYNYCANNPVKYIDPTGMIIDPSNLSASEKEAYDAKIKLLTTNMFFYSYYNRLLNSETTYYIKPGSGAGGSGSFNSSTNEIHSVDNLQTLVQELFHAYQSDLNVYNSNDRSVRETEGDIVSSCIALYFSMPGLGNSWDQGIGINYTENDYSFKESVLSSSFDMDFNKAVNARINLYLNREQNEGAKAPSTYVQMNSGIGALALKKMFREAKANTDLVGPRLPNGDYFSN